MSASCPKCGNPIRSGAKFCGKCGQALNTASVATPNPASTPPQTPLIASPAPSSGSIPPAQRPARRFRGWVGVGLLVYLLGMVGVILLERVIEARTATPVVTPLELAVTPREAGQKGLNWLLTNAVSWQQTQQCYGCHVQSFALMGAAAASANEYSVDGEAARTLIDYLASLQSSQGYISTGQGEVGLVIQTVLAGIGISEYDEQIASNYGATLVAMADWLVEQQAGVGNWPLDHQEAPVDQGETMTTAGALVTLVAAQRHEAKPAYAQAIQQGAAWLRNTALTTTQDMTFALIGLTTSGVENRDPDLTRIIEQLKSQQNADGGWGETTTLESNGYATGQVLYAYKLADVALADPSFREGVLWLLDHQQQDGSWQQIHSQQTQSDRSSNYATTMWAVIGLGEIFDAATEAAFISLIHPNTGAPSTPGVGALVIFLLIPMLLVAPIWWRRQGRRWQRVRQG